MMCFVMSAYPAGAKSPYCTAECLSPQSLWFWVDGLCASIQFTSCPSMAQRPASTSSGFRRDFSIWQRTSPTTLLPYTDGCLPAAFVQLPWQWFVSYHLAYFSIWVKQQGFLLPLGVSLGSRRAHLTWCTFARLVWVPILGQDSSQATCQHPQTETMKQIDSILNCHREVDFTSGWSHLWNICCYIYVSSLRSFVQPLRRSHWIVFESEPWCEMCLCRMVWHTCVGVLEHQATHQPHTPFWYVCWYYGCGM